MSLGGDHLKGPFFGGPSFLTESGSMVLQADDKPSPNAKKRKAGQCRTAPCLLYLNLNLK